LGNELYPKYSTLNLTPWSLADPGVWTQPIFAQKKIPQDRIANTIAVSEIDTRQKPGLLPATDKILTSNDAKPFSLFDSEWKI